MPKSSLCRSIKTGNTCGVDETACLIPVDGFYEWRKVPDGKLPYYFASTGQPVESVPLPKCGGITS